MSRLDKLTDSDLENLEAAKKGGNMTFIKLQDISGNTLRLNLSQVSSVFRRKLQGDAHSIEKYGAGFVTLKEIEGSADEGIVHTTYKLNDAELTRLEEAIDHDR